MIRAVVGAIFWVPLLALILYFTGWLGSALTAVIVVPLGVWAAWQSFKWASSTTLHKAGEYLSALIGGLIAAITVFVLVAEYFGRPQGIVIGVVAVVACLALTPMVAQAGIARWQNEKRGVGRSTVYGNARFLTFDADLDWPLASRLNHPTGSGPFLGFCEANLVPTFFHRLTAWIKNPREMATVAYQGYRFRPLVYDGPSHLITIAPARSGKGTCAIIPNLLTLNQPVICIDPKGENAAVTRRHRESLGAVFLLNPFNEHGMGTSRYNPLAALDITSPNVVADAAGLAEALIISEGKEPFFTDSARDLIRALILYLVATKGKDATLPEMRRLLTLPSGGDKNDKFGVLIFEMMESPYSYISQPASRFQNVDRTTQSIISTAIAQTSFLDDPVIANVLSDSEFTIQDFKKEVATLYIILPSRYLASYSRFFRLIVVSALDQLTAVASGNRVVMLLDEFAQLGHLSAIETAFGLAAGYNVQLWPFLQDINQLKDIYKARWETFLANAGVVQWFAPNDMTTAEYLSKRLGNTTAVTTSINKKNLWTKLSSGPGGEKTRGEAGVPLQTPQDLMAMDKDVDPDPDIKAQVLNVAGIDLPIRCLRAPYDAQIFKMPIEFANYPKYRELVRFHTSDWKPFFDPNPFHQA